MHEPRVVCSTPDGIDEGFTRHLGLTYGRGNRCSTPDGIDEGFTLNAFREMIRIKKVLNA